MEEQKQEFTVEKSAKTPFFTAKKIAVMAMFSALAFAISLLEIALFPTTPAFYLELDFGNVFIMLVAFLLGPIEGVIVCAVKESLHLFVGSTGGVGELANFITTSAYLLFPAIIYQKHKGIKTVLLSLVGACFIASGVSLIVNRFLLIPAFGIADPSGFFSTVWGLTLAFNLIKTVSVSALTVLLYKRLSNVLKKWKV